MTNRYTTNNNNIPYDILAKELTHHHHHHTFYFISISNTHTHTNHMMLRNVAMKRESSGEYKTNALGTKKEGPLLQMRRRREH